MNADIVEQRLIEKIRKLSSTRIVEIEDFIDFLSERENQSDANLTFATNELSEAAFVKVWDNPEDANFGAVILLAAEDRSSIDPRNDRFTP
jgi:hypothetical protein